MHGIGLIVWVVLLFVGVLGSIVSSIRKQAQQRGNSPVTVRRPPPRPAMPPVPGGPPFANQAPEPGQLPQWLDRMLAAQQAAQPAPAAVARPIAPKPASASTVASSVRGKPVPRPAPAEAFVMEHRAPKARRLFASNGDLVRAVIAAEVLGKPRGLGEEYPSY